MSPIYEVSLCLIIEADNEDEACKIAASDYDLEWHLEATEVTDEFAQSFPDKEKKQ